MHSSTSSHSAGSRPEKMASVSVRFSHEKSASHAPLAGSTPRDSAREGNRAGGGVTWVRVWG